MCSERVGKERSERPWGHPDRKRGISLALPPGNPANICVAGDAAHKRPANALAPRAPAETTETPRARRARQHSWPLLPQPRYLPGDACSETWCNYKRDLDMWHFNSCCKLSQMESIYSGAMLWSYSLVVIIFLNFVFNITPKRLEILSASVGKGSFQYLLLVLVAKFWVLMRKLVIC